MSRAMRVAILLFLIACKSASPTEPAPVKPVEPLEPMATFTINGYLLAGAEYWPYDGTAEIKYPDAVLWGFYPEKGVIGPGEDTPRSTPRSPAFSAQDNRSAVPRIL